MMESIEKTSINSKYRYAAITSQNGGSSPYNHTMRLNKSPVLYHYNIEEEEMTDVVRDESRIADEPMICFQPVSTFDEEEFS